MGVVHYVDKNVEEAVSYEEALKKAGSGKFQAIVVIVGGFILLSSYVSVGAIAYVLPAAQCDLDMDSEAKGRLASIGFIGLIISCHFWGFLSDTLGRRYILIRCLFVDGLLYFATSLTPYYSAILVLRLINGFMSSGGVASIYAYMGEFFTDKNRTKALMAASMVATFSYFIVPIYAWLTISSKFEFQVYPGLIFKSWRLFYAVSGIPSLTCSLLIYFLPESPKFLLAKGQTAKAIEVLKRIHKINSRDDAEDYLVKDIITNENEKVATLEGDTNKAIAFLRLMWNQTVPLFKGPHRLNIALVCLTQFLAYFSNGGIYLWLPETFNRLAIYRDETNNEYASFCDVIQHSRQSMTNLTEKFSRIYFDNAVSSTIIPDVTNVVPTCSDNVNTSVYLYLGMLGVIQTINLGVITAVSKIFNKKYILIGLTVCALLSSIGVEFMEVTDFAVYNSSLLIIFTGAIIPIINSVVVELFPTNLRAMAACLTLMSCRLGTVTTNIIAGMLIDNHCRAFMGTFIVAMAICLITLGLMPTKSKPLQNQDNNSTEI